MPRILFATTALLLATLLVSCDKLESMSVAGQPRTFEAATKVAQEFVDRRAAGDYAGAWQLFDGRTQSGISQSDYVSLTQTCASAIYKIPSTATGGRMDGDSRALVLFKPLGFAVELPVIYEVGQWRMEPSDDFAAELGKPVDQIIAKRRAEGHCGGPDSSKIMPTTSTAPSPTVPTVDKAQVARQITDDLFRQFGSRPDSVTCPEDLKGTPWATLRCELKDSGQTYGVTVTVNSVQGSDVNYGFKVDEKPNNAAAPSRPIAGPSATPAATQTVDQFLSNTPEASERPILGGLRKQGYGYLDYSSVIEAWDRTCSLFGGAPGASDAAVNDAKERLIGMRFTPAEADAIVGIALRVHRQPGIESCP